MIRRTGAVLAGRRSYDVGRRGERPEVEEAFGGGWSGAQFVLTHRPHDPDPANTFLSGDVRDAVALALVAAEGKDLNIIGADVARQCLAAGLIDEMSCSWRRSCSATAYASSAGSTRRRWSSNRWRSQRGTRDDPALSGTP